MSTVAQEKELSLEDINIQDPSVRKWLVKEYGLWGFSVAYLSHHFYREPADFHPDLILSLEDPDEMLLWILGFRGSAKSTYASLAYVLYIALENISQFILPVSDTGDQNKLTIENIRYELENNELIRKDYPNSFDPNKNFSASKIMLNNGVLIMGRSRGQKMRGLKHRQFRPQVVIVDDPEDLKWVKKKKNRDATEQWFNSEVIPAQEEDEFKLILIGNLLHKNALMMRIKAKKRADGTSLFKCLEFPLLDKETGECTWRGKYPTDEDVQKQKEKVGSPTAWSREYLLEIVAEEDQVIKETDIKYYKNSLLTDVDRMQRKIVKPLDAGVGNDLAISEEESADYTAFVGGYRVVLAIGDDEKAKDHILVLPNPTNKHLDFDETIKEALAIEKRMMTGTKFFMEDVQYQKSAIQTAKKFGLTVMPIRPVSDKTARLEAVSPFIKDGTVLFPEFGCEELLEQLLGFPTEEHDDLVDALVYMILGLMNRSRARGASKSDAI